MTMLPPGVASATRLTDAQRLDWLRLIRCENIGPRTFYALLNRFGGAGAALDALPGLVARHSGGRRIAIAKLADCEIEMADIGRRGISLVALGEPEYPPALRAIDAPPPLIAVRGRLGVLQAPMVAIVGSRNASAAGRTFAERLARELGAAGHVIVSGLARGIDLRSHQASLTSGTVAVLAGGHDRIYPAEHAGLLEAILEHGAAVSEMPMGWEPRGRDFPRRNRIVAGLSLATVVVEAARRSGSLITARFAAEQGREVFAVPGSPLDPRAEGTNGLLREGATFCTCAADVIDALAPLLRDGPVSPPRLGEGGRIEQYWDEWDRFENEAPAAAAGIELHKNEAAPDGDRQRNPAAVRDTRARILDLLGPVPVAVDDLVRVAEASVAEVTMVLLEIELAGRLERHGGNLVSLIAGTGCRAANGET
jgi:DNA processing protein